MADYECRATSGAYIRFSNLKELYENHLVQQQSPRRRVTGFLLSTTLFMDKSATYIDMTYLWYFIDPTIVHEWNWGAAILSWIIYYFHHIHDYDVDPAYIDAMSSTARYVLQRGDQKVGPYRVYLDRIAHDDIQWTPLTNYDDVVPFDRITLYYGWLACGTDTIVRPAHEEILGNQQTEDDHATDLLPICQRIHMIGQDALNRGIIEQDSPEAVAVVERMASDAAGAAAYRRQRRSQGVRIRQ
ncbi:uncharacterized protein LOC131605122 [Vicia villosa]|uniref:uncharacterized protein LOC131605122 n=1 Tax=Vicia villosa TaxID=3911 RepID=UPI00273AE172|nr:uncharacterized protein LOC131605122 [Vicia villosa]